MLTVNIVPGLELNLTLGCSEQLLLGLAIKLLYSEPERKLDLDKLVRGYQNLNQSCFNEETKEALSIASNVIYKVNVES